jgi:PadR family transcriptional regulator, regulatory protein PadR
MPLDRSDVLQGTLDMLVLKLLTAEANHGWGLSMQLRALSRDVFDVNQGSLYPALQRMLRRGWIRSTWRLTEHNRRARYYDITAEGRRQLDRSVGEWQRTSGAVDRVLRLSFSGA